jgi:MtrB/PioB family decaheme-associated outer membrane protein
MQPITSLLTTLLLAGVTVSHTVMAAPPACRNCPEATGWSGSIDLGLGYQSVDAWGMGRYSGAIDSGIAPALSLDLLYRGEEAEYMRFELADPDGATRTVNLQMGRQGRYRFDFWQRDTPFYRDEIAFSPFRSQLGSLSLPATWVKAEPEGRADSLVPSLQWSPLYSQRDRQGFGIALPLGDKWQMEAKFRRELRQGRRDQGATFGLDQITILPVAYEYRNDEFDLTLARNGQRAQYAFSWSSAMLRNEWPMIRWQNPFGNQQGELADYPTNRWHQLAATMGYQLSSATRLHARLASAHLYQDEPLLSAGDLPYLAALPAPSLTGEVATTQATLGINHQITRQWRIDGDMSYSRRDNRTPSLIFTNYAVTDSELGGPRRSRNYGFEQRQLRLRSGWRQSADSRITAGYDYDRHDRTLVEVAHTWDHRLWGRWQGRPMSQLDASLKVSSSKRNASKWAPLDSQDPLLDNPLTGRRDHPLMRIHNMSDRERQQLGLQLDLTLFDPLLLTLDVEQITDRYSAMVIGLNQAEGLNWSVSARWSMEEWPSLSLIYGYDQLTSRLAGSERLSSISNDVRWVARNEHLTELISGSAEWPMGEEISLRGEFTYSEYSGSVTYGGGDSLADIGAISLSTRLEIDYRWDEELTLRGGYRYERYEERDWSEGGQARPLGSLIGLGVAPQRYEGFALYAGINYRF